MRIILILALIISQVALAQKDGPTKETYEIASDFGFSKEEIFRKNRTASREIDENKINETIKNSYFKDRETIAKNADKTLESILFKAKEVLISMGHDNAALEIESEYNLYYKNSFYNNYIIGNKEIGDHPPLSEWLDKVHLKIEDTIGKMLCDFFHFHDIFILNYGIPVILNPDVVDLEDYKDHFAGHLIWGFFWEHHGVAGVFSYWAVYGACVAVTFGGGAAPFVCGPVAQYAEHLMDKHISPRLAARIWNRANGG